MTNRASRRAQAREDAKARRSKDVLQNTTRSIVRDSDFDGLAPVPSPITTNLGPYKYGGKTWALLSFGMENSLTHVVFAPGDARKFAEDVLQVVERIEGRAAVMEEEVAEVSGSSGKIVIAKELPRD